MKEKESIVCLGPARVEAQDKVARLGKYVSLKGLGTLRQILLTFISRLY